MNTSIAEQRLDFGFKRKPNLLKLAGIRDITYLDISAMSEGRAFDFLIKCKWGSRKKVVCPSCGTIGEHYVQHRSKRWRCKSTECNSYFSLFSGTPFQDRKLTYKKILLGLCSFVIFPNGVSFEVFSGLLDIQVKSSQVFQGKIREVLVRNSPQEKLSGVVHIDGGHFGGRPRHARVRRVATESIVTHVENMLTRPHGRQPASTMRANAARRIKNRRIVFVLRQLSEVEGQGAVRTIVAVGDSENEKFALSLALKFIEPGSTVMSDENPAYNQFSMYFDHHVVVHSQEFATLDGINSNQAESYFSRLRRHVLGVSHRIEAKYLLDIATEMAWREDVRRLTYGERLHLLLDAIFSTGRSKYWRGYWQGCKRPGELVWSPDDNKPIIR